MRFFTILAASLFLSFSTPVLADDGFDPKALTALRDLIKNPNQPVPDVVNAVGFHAAHYIVDKLTRGEQYNLRILITQEIVTLPNGFTTALFINKAGQPIK